MSLLQSSRIPLRVGAAFARSARLASGLAFEQRFTAITPARSDQYVRRWARAMLESLHVETKVDGNRTLAPGRSHLIVSNHRSSVDIFTVLDIFGGHMLARGDMAKWPFMGQLAQLAGTLFVDRSDQNSRSRAVRQMTEHLQRGLTIGVFPEGTTYVDDEVHPFHAGAFLAASRAGALIVPVGLAYADPESCYGDHDFAAHFRKILEAERTTVSVAIGHPIDPADLPVHALRDRAHAAVQQLVHHARARL